MDAGDPWAAARMRAREEVRAAFAPRPVTCSNCGNEETTGRRSCSRCGAPYVTLRDPGILRATRRRITIATVATIVVIGIAAAVILPQVQETKRHADAAARADARAALVRERARIVRDQRLRSAVAPGPRSQLSALPRARLVARLRSDLESSITADARARVRAGELSGPITATRCSAAQGSAATRFGRYTCTAVNRDIVRAPGQSAAGVLGYPFWAIVDFRRLRYAWCKVNPQAGEGSATPRNAGLAVPPPRGCDITR